MITHGTICSQCCNRGSNYYAAVSSNMW